MIVRQLTVVADTMQRDNDTARALLRGLGHAEDGIFRYTYSLYAGVHINYGIRYVVCCI